MIQATQSINQRRSIPFTAFLLVISTLLGGCAWNMPAHAPVPEDSIFVSRAPKSGTDTAGTRRYYNEKYIGIESSAEVRAFYETKGATCKVYDSPTTRELESTIWICHNSLTDDSTVTLHVYIVSQEGILQDIKEAELEGRMLIGLPMRPSPSDPSGETVIITTINLYED